MGEVVVELLLELLNGTVDTMLDDTLDDLSASVARHTRRQQAVVFLATAERWRILFAGFDRVAHLDPGLCDIIDECWRSLDHDELHERLEAALEDRVPGEEWVVDGLWDGLAQCGANLLAGALRFELDCPRLSRTVWPAAPSFWGARGSTRSSQVAADVVDARAIYDAVGKMGVGSRKRTCAWFVRTLWKVLPADLMS